jgi:hypothetical protein
VKAGTLRRMQLSKSDYILYLKHPAWLWLKKNNPDFLPKPDQNALSKMNEGQLFEAFIEDVFPKAIHLDRRDFKDTQQWADKTKQLIKKGVETILQPAFIYEDYLCIADALTRTEDGYILTEIKATTSPEKKPAYVCDLSFQKVVIELNNIPIVQTRILHADKEYIRQGEIALDKLAKFYDTSAKVNKVEHKTIVNMQEAVAVMNSPTIPSDSIRFAGLGGAKKWRTIYRKLHPEIEPYSIYDLASNKGSGMGKVIATLEDNHITRIVDIPEDMKLQDHQKLQVALTKSGRPAIDKKAINSFIDRAQFPIYFLDYESFNPILPPFDNTWPCEHVVFQHSVHIMQQDGSITHDEFLHEENNNPSQKLIESLKRIIGAQGSIIVWHQQFETDRHIDLAKLYPEHAEYLLGLNDRVIDLEEPFCNKMYQAMELKGSSSIKNVLPHLCPHSVSYKSLGIQEGQTASRSWREAVVDGTIENKGQVFRDLKEYCGVDTLAMVEIWKSLTGM